MIDLSGDSISASPRPPKRRLPDTRHRILEEPRARHQLGRPTRQRLELSTPRTAIEVNDVSTRSGEPTSSRHLFCAALGTRPPAPSSGRYRGELRTGQRTPAASSEQADDDPAISFASILPRASIAFSAIRLDHYIGKQGGNEQLVADPLKFPPYSGPRAQPRERLEKDLPFLLTSCIYNTNIVGV